MIHLQQAQDALLGFLDLGGWVVGVILALSVLSGAVVIAKLVQFRAAGVGRHGALIAALDASDRGARSRAIALADSAPSHLGPVLARALQTGAGRDRLYTLAEGRLARLDFGFRLLDTVAQIAPLLGLFGTVLGMIDAFRAMQEAGQDVDPSVLAGGIWVALMTTAAGLAVAMPVTAILAWFEGRMTGERRMAEMVIEGALSPDADATLPDDRPVAGRARGAAHA
ncbi:MotA/TolQ/ExbB proton channel family protein [Halodurantibacterium flavum]|uniref:MotA/TolQ/ExbB proton channel family protein n=1 Tax=Halodurantibacterium flavum TaxID=1382802 RepID=A0ABW4S1V6_9RHOB